VLLPVGDALQDGRGAAMRSGSHCVGVAAGVLLAAWGVVIRLNKSEEELEPEAMAQAKSEDEKVQ